MRDQSSWLSVIGTLKKLVSYSNLQTVQSAAVKLEAGTAMACDGTMRVDNVGKFKIGN